MMNLYQENLMDHFRNPRHRGAIPNPDFTSGVHNPSCGDSVSIAGRLTQNTVSKVAFDGQGCVISQAAASMLCEQILGMSLDHIKKLNADYMLKLVGIQLGPTRLRCALLCLEALHEGIEDSCLAQTV